MKFFITGTSGVGKTFLEECLAQKLSFFQLPKTTDRKRRYSEKDSQGIKFKTTKEILDNIDRYFFRLEYLGQIYVWEKEDLQKHENCVMAVTLESMESLLKLNLGFIPILLYIDPNNLKLLEDRMKTRYRYSELKGQDLKDANKMLKDRMALAKIESLQIKKYIDIISKYSTLGRAFEIKDDATLFDEVIPYIENLINLQSSPKANLP